MRYLKVVVHSPYVGTDDETLYELPEDWDEMGPQERTEFEDDCWDQSVCRYIDGHTEIVEES